MEAMPDCLFCKIGSGKIPSKVVLQDDEMFAFDDVNPQAPVHVLVIPKRHIGGLNDAEDRALLGRLLETAALVAKKKGRSEEHTSELQSRLHLVCRLLLEKKKKKDRDQRISKVGPNPQHVAST